MGFWAETVLPRMLDMSLDQDEVRALRKEALADATGRVLEVGFGSGLNVTYFPEAVTELVAIDPSPGMRKRAEPRIAASGRTVRFELLSGESLPFDDASFDAVACTFTLCTIDPVEQALSEIVRVLRPGGAFLFVEHGLSPDPGVRRFQRWLNPIQWQMVGGCQLIKDPLALIEAAGMRVERQRGLYLDGAPRTHGWVTLGKAIRPLES